LQAHDDDDLLICLGALLREKMAGGQKMAGGNQNVLQGSV